MYVYLTYDSHLSASYNANNTFTFDSYILHNLKKSPNTAKNQNKQKNWSQSTQFTSFAYTHLHTHGCKIEIWLISLLLFLLLCYFFLHSISPQKSGVIHFKRYTYKQKTTKKILSIMCVIFIFCYFGWNSVTGIFVQSCLYGHQNAKNCRLTTQSQTCSEQERSGKASNRKINKNKISNIV